MLKILVCSQAGWTCRHRPFRTLPELRTRVLTRTFKDRRPVRCRAFLRATLAFLPLLLIPYLPGQEIKASAAVFAPVLAELKQQTQVPILLPARLPPLVEDSVYASASAKTDSYSIRLESDPGCDGANACFLGIFRARRGGQFSFPETVKIDKDAQGRYKGTTCGGSCSSPAIEWKSNGVLYTVQLNLRTGDEKKARTWMTELAQESLLAGPR